MGFDINIYMSLNMCPKTGKPFIYGKNFERIYELPEIVVPEKMCEYLEGRGHLFHAYTETFNEENRYDVGVDEFLEEYPDWVSVQEHLSYEEAKDYWSFEDHEGFKRLLEWCAEQKVGFRVSWSY